MGWVVLLPALAVLFVFNKRVNPNGRGRNAVAVITMLLAAIAGCGLAYTFAGRWVADFVSWVGSVASRLAGDDLQLGVSIAFTLLLFGVALADIAFDKKADRGAQVAAILAPTAIALLIGGTWGESGGAAVHSVSAQVAAFMHTNFGGA